MLAYSYIAKMTTLVYAVLLAVLSQICDSYRILVIFPLPGTSHDILGQGYVEHLLDAGHEVTYVTPFPTNKTTSKYHEVDVSENIEIFEEQKFTLQQLLDKELAFSLTDGLPKFIKMMRMTLEGENFRKFYSDPSNNFDVVIVEWFFNDIHAGFSTVFNCPVIWSSSIEPHWMILRLIHEPSNPSFNADPTATYVPPFTFVQRAKSLVFQLLVQAVKFFYLDSVEKGFYEEFFGPAVAKRGRTLPPYEDVRCNASFMLTNSHSSFSQSISVPPNVKEIGGYHIDPKVKPLPADVQKLMDEAEHGVIYFSMGSNVKSKGFPEVLKRNFLRVFGEFKQTVIWKFEEDLPNRPKNVHIVHWAPQTSILAHPNLRMFITHGGLLSSTETIFFGVPTIVIPYGNDQYINAIRAVKKGYALRVDLSYEMADDLRLAMEEMLSTSRYKERVKELSKIYHDRLVPPGKELVHWVEHVARTGGAPHLRSPALMLPWYQKMYLDLAVLVILVLWILKIVLKKLCSKVKLLFNKNATVNKKKSN